MIHSITVPHRESTHTGWVVLSPDVLNSNHRRRVFRENAFVVVRHAGGWTHMVYTEDGDPHFPEKDALTLASKMGGKVVHRDFARQYETSS